MALSRETRAERKNRAFSAEEEVVKKVDINKDSYHDSVFLMLVNKEAKGFEGVNDAVVSMGTPMNLEILENLGFDVKDVTPNDLIVAVDAESEDAADQAIAAAHDMIRNKASASESEGEYNPASLNGALQDMPDANMVIISVPGEYAAEEVRKALNKDLHVMLFSDNVPIEDEIELKKTAREKGLLMMGPDCGTAIINGKPLCFSNVVKRGPIGMVAASGTGLQEVSCVIDERGSGLTQGIGTGGRDLKDDRIGGAMMITGIEALRDDDDTKVITVVSKPPAESVADKVIKALEETGKPCVVHFIGLMGQKDRGNLHFADNLEEAAGMAVALAQGKEYTPTTFTIPESEVKKIVDRETKSMSSDQKYLRGLYTGGTLADEAVILLNDDLGGIHSFDSKDPKFGLKDPHVSEEHTIVDLGEDVFTVGRPHPMIDPSTREERLRKEADDPEVAVLLMDIVLGYGSHEDPAGAMVDGIRDAKEKAKKRGGYLPVIVSITGTAGDPQDLGKSQKTLEEAGAVVMPSNYQASKLALEIMNTRR